ncbi:hypothetical protein V7122_02255, partial [Bacillus sp. JJ1532]|uniref:hypothetical protein n=1 Tax=Bacillus sp. JJ1532 TaxID=3122958 RepID=UPI002FFDC88C
ENLSNKKSLLDRKREKTENCPTKRVYWRGNREKQKTCPINDFSKNKLSKLENCIKENLNKK